VPKSSTRKGHNGKRITNNVIYGYLKDSDDKNKWTVDPVGADVVRWIFAMSANGKGSYQIACALENDMVEIPSVYLGRLGVGTKKLCGEVPFPLERGDNRAYAGKAGIYGAHCELPFHKESYKDKKQTFNPQKNWAVFENTHEAIVDPETWQMAQRCLFRLFPVRLANNLLGYHPHILHIQNLLLQNGIFPIHFPALGNQSGTVGFPVAGRKNRA